MKLVESEITIESARSSGNNRFLICLFIDMSFQLVYYSARA